MTTQPRKLKPSWAGRHWTPASTTAATLDAWQAEAEEVDAAVREEVEELRVLHGQLHARLLLLGASATAAALRLKAKIITPARWTDEVSRRRGAVQEAQRQRSAEDARRAREREQRALEERAVLWLHGRGLQPGVDYTAGDALRRANELAFDDEVARRGELPEGVCWVRGDDHSFEHPSVHAEPD